MSPSHLMFVNVYAPIGGCCSLHLQKVSLAMYVAVHVVRNHQLFLKIFALCEDPFRPLIQLIYLASTPC